MYLQPAILPIFNHLVSLKINQSICITQWYYSAIYRSDFTGKRKAMLNVTFDIIFAMRKDA